MSIDLSVLGERHQLDRAADRCSATSISTSSSSEIGGGPPRLSAVPIGRRRRRAQEGVDDVVDVGEVAALLAVAVDRIGSPLSAFLIQIPTKV